MPDETLSFTSDQYATLTTLATALGLTVNQYLQAYANDEIEKEEERVIKNDFLKAPLSVKKAWAASQQEE